MQSNTVQVKSLNAIKDFALILQKIELGSYIYQCDAYFDKSLAKAQSVLSFKQTQENSLRSEVNILEQDIAKTQQAIANLESEYASTKRYLYYCAAGSDTPILNTIQAAKMQEIKVSLEEHKNKLQTLQNQLSTRVAQLSKARDEIYRLKSHMQELNSLQKHTRIRLDMINEEICSKIQYTTNLLDKGSEILEKYLKG